MNRQDFFARSQKSGFFCLAISPLLPLLHAFGVFLAELLHPVKARLVVLLAHLVGILRFLLSVIAALHQLHVDKERHKNVEPVSAVGEFPRVIGDLFVRVVHEVDHDWLCDQGYLWNDLGNSLNFSELSGTPSGEVNRAPSELCIIGI